MREAAKHELCSRCLHPLQSAPLPREPERTNRPAVHKTLQAGHLNTTPAATRACSCIGIPAQQHVLLSHSTSVLGLQSPAQQRVCPVFHPTSVPSLQFPGTTFWHPTPAPHAPSKRSIRQSYDQSLPCAAIPAITCCTWWRWIAPTGISRIARLAEIGTSPTNHPPTTFKPPPP